MDLRIEDKLEISQEKNVENLGCPPGNQPPNSGCPESSGYVRKYFDVRNRAF